MGDEEHFLSNKYYYIDGKWNHCKDFSTVTFSVYHPVLRKQVPLFIMKCGEKQEFVVKKPDKDQRGFLIPLTNK